MKDVFYKTGGQCKGFSLAEVLAALTIGAMILVSVLGIYNRLERCATAVTDRLDSSRLASEVLQRIAEDLDKVTLSGTDTRITVANKLDNLYQTARLEILKTIYDGKNQKQTFEKIVWQTSFDYESAADGLVLYRSYTGISDEDKVLDKSRASWEKNFSFVPICTGVTVFKIQIPQGEVLRNEWRNDSPPKGLVVTVSFAEPFKTVEGSLDVLDEEKTIRTIAVDRTRKVNFKLVERNYGEDNEEEEEEEEKEEEEKEKLEDENKEQNKESSKRTK
jgi:prepilin-type N-terminal cleavage/methylation domain-containing protein